MKFEEFKELVNSYVQAKLDYLNYSYQSSYRQDDEYTSKAITANNKIKNLYEEIIKIIETTNDKRFSEYFSDENITDLMQKLSEELVNLK